MRPDNATPALPYPRDLYPELAAGGFSRVDGTVAFYTRVHALLGGLQDGAVVVDYGAGRGAFLEDPVPYRRELHRLTGPGRRVFGVDIDPAVLENTGVDEQRVVDFGARLPFENGSVDVIVSDHTFEHVTDPAWVSAELTRILRPGGWICARTPNKWGYIAVGARLVPNRLHVSALRHLQPSKHERDTFPTAYALNTKGDLERWFPRPRFDHIVWASDAEPNYAAGSPSLARIALALSKISPPPFRSILQVFLHKRAADGRGDPGADLQALGRPTHGAVEGEPAAAGESPLVDRGRGER